MTLAPSAVLHLPMKNRLTAEELRRLRNDPARRTGRASPAPRPIDPVRAAETKRRFEICKTCEYTIEDGHKCELHKGCCFGGWRANPKNTCHAAEARWAASEVNHGSR